MKAEEVKLYNLQELADMLKVSKQTIYNYKKIGRINAKRYGREYKVTEAELQRILKNGL